MSTLLVLLGSFALLTLIHWLHPSEWLNLSSRGRLALAMLFTFTGIGHFFFVEEMMQMIPPLVPARELLVYLTGVLEIAGAIGILIPSLQRLAGYALIAFLLGVLPANIYASLNYTGMGSHADGHHYLWFRVPLQLLFIAWTWLFALAGDKRLVKRVENSAPIQIGESNP